MVEVAPDRGGGAEVGGELDAGEGEVGRREEPPLQVARDGELAAERLGLGARGDARLEVAGHLVEAGDELRELVASAQPLPDGEVPLLDLGEAVREAATGRGQDSARGRRPAPQPPQ
ncbi:MAG TPA: hypothetical protein PKA62_07895, partial [Thermoanaerobaculia bacterium]|nr:hypothetical protein [Thermoanaerobaculia bacterium]